MGINMGVYIGLVCLLLACQGVFSSYDSFEINSYSYDNSKQSNSIQISNNNEIQQRGSSRRSIDILKKTVKVKNATTVTVNHKNVTALVTKELVYTCEVVDTTTPHFTEITRIDFVALDEYGNETAVARVVPNHSAATYFQYADEKATGVINNVPAFPEKSTSGTGYLSLNISYPTSEQIYTFPTTKRTVCKVQGYVRENLAKEEADTSVNVVEPTFQSLGGRFVIEPENIKTLLSENLTVACHFTGIEAVKTVKKIEIRKNGMGVAACDAAGHCVATNITDFPGGNITGGYDGSSGYLKAFVNYPTKDHSGSFDCLITVHNQEDMPLDAESDTEDVVATNPTLKDLIDWTIDNKQETDEEIKKLKAENTILNTWIDDADDDINDIKEFVIFSLLSSIFNKDQRVKMTNRITSAENEIKKLKPGQTCYKGSRKTYTGTVSLTQNGRTCQAWIAQTPHIHHNSNKASHFPDGVFPSNYCRSPKYDPASRPWCYTTDPHKRWEYCAVYQC